MYIWLYIYSVYMHIDLEREVYIPSRITLFEYPLLPRCHLATQVKLPAPAAPAGLDTKDSTADQKEINKPQTS